MKVCISAESTIDLPKELLKEWDIHTVPFTLLMGEKSALDGEVGSAELFAFTEKTGKLPKTSAVNRFQYEEHFKKLLEEYDCIIHIALSSKISSAYENASAVAEGMENVYVINSLSLSTGIALQAIYARKLANVGKDPKEIVKLVEERIPNDQTSFSLESVNYLYKGGRCSMLAMLGANLLGLKPEIFVKDGAMVAGKKYRGPMKKVVMAYVEDTLEMFPNIDPEQVFITYSTAPEDVLSAVKERLEKAGFKRIDFTTAGGTISCHCGPHCLGILYMNDGPHPIKP